MDPNQLPTFAGLGIVAVLIWAVLVVGGFILSAWIMSLYVRLVIRFSRKALDREYRYMRGDYFATAPTGSRHGNDPRSW